MLLAGARDLDPPEVTYLASAPVRRAEVGDLDAARVPDGPLYVHVDLDVIDSGDLPGLRYPAPGGPGPADVAGCPPAVCSARAGSPRWASRARGIRVMARRPVSTPT